LEFKAEVLDISKHTIDRFRARKWAGRLGFLAFDDEREWVGSLHVRTDREPLLQDQSSDNQCEPDHSPTKKDICVGCLFRVWREDQKQAIATM
jgi:hypothetical protein